MKKSLLSLLVLCCNICLGQDTDTEPMKKHEFGVNITALINSVIDLGEDPGSPDFNFFYRNIGNKTSYRLAAITRFINNSNDVSGSDVESKSSALGLRFGVEGNKSVSTRFDLIYSWDFLLRNTKSSSENSNSGFVNTQNEFTIGTGPGLRIQYNISENVSLMTESVFYLALTKNKSTLDQFGQQQITSENSNFNTFSRIPTSIFLTMRF